MFLYKLKPLKKKMLENNQLAISFDYNFNEKNITIIFFSLEQMILSFINNENKKFLSIEVYDDFSINTLFKEDDYKALIEILEIKFNKENPFSPSTFLFEFSKSIPSFEDVIEIEAKKKIKYLKNFVEDIKKTSLIGKNDHKKDKNIVSVKNLNKTMLLLGRDLALKNKKNNISTIWGEYKK